MWRSAVQLCQGLLDILLRYRKRGISSVGLEHLPCTQGVKGSSPLFSTDIEMKKFILFDNETEFFDMVRDVNIIYEHI